MTANQKSATVALLAIGVIGLIVWLVMRPSRSTTWVARDDMALENGGNPQSASSDTTQTPGIPEDPASTRVSKYVKSSDNAPVAPDGRATAAIAAACRLGVQLSPAPDEECDARITLSYPGTRAWKDFEFDGESRMLNWGDVPPTGLCEWENLPPDVPLHLEVNSMGVVLASADFQPLATGEHRFSELVLTKRPEAVLVKVRGLDGKSVRRALLKFMVAGGYGERHDETDENGIAELKLYLPDSLDLAVAADGYASTVLRRIDLSTRKLLVILEEERIVDVELFDMEGKALVGRATVSAMFDSELGVFEEVKTGPAVWRLDKLPVGEVVIAVRTQQGMFSILHDTANARAKVVVKPGIQFWVWASFKVDESMKLDDWAVKATSLTNSEYSTREFGGRNWGLEKDVVFDSLPPDSYRMQIEHRDVSQPNSWEAWGSASTVEVVGTKRMYVKLGR